MVSKRLKVQGMGKGEGRGGGERKHLGKTHIDLNVHLNIIYKRACASAISLSNI